MDKIVAGEGVGLSEFRPHYHHTNPERCFNAMEEVLWKLGRPEKNPIQSTKTMSFACWTKIAWTERFIMKVRGWWFVKNSVMIFTTLLKLVK